MKSPLIVASVFAGAAAILTLVGLANSLGARKLERDLLLQQAVTLENRNVTATDELKALAPSIEEDLSAFTIIDPNPDSAAIRFQELIRVAVLASSGTPISIEATSQILSDNLGQVRLALKASFSEEAALSFIRGVEIGPPAMMIEDIDIRPSSAQQGQIELSALLLGLHADAS